VTAHISHVLDARYKEHAVSDNWHNIMSDPPITIAAQSGDVAALRRELDYGVSPNVLDRYGWTPFHHLCHRGDNAEGRVDCLHVLLQAGADINAPNGSRRSTPLHHAARYSHENVVAALLEAGADINKGDSANSTPLHLACCRRDSVGPALVLIKNGADVNARDDGQDMSETPLDLAIINSSRRLVPILVRAGAALDNTWPDTYIQKVIAAGGIKNYERTHLNAITATFIPKLPLLPPEMVRSVVEYAFHVGDY